MSANILQERVCIPSLSGGLEGRFYQPQETLCGWSAVFCSPHPLHGGTMEHKVVTTSARVLAELGCPTLCFQYRGVGGSPGSWGGGEGELQDGNSALEHLIHQTSPRHILLGGFSFGAWIAARLAILRADANAVLSVGTAPQTLDYSFFDSSIPCPIFFVQGTEDSFGTVSSIRELAHLAPDRCSLRVVEGADHFFNRSLRPLAESVESFCRPLFDR